MPSSSIIGVLKVKWSIGSSTAPLDAVMGIALSAEMALTFGQSLEPVVAAETGPWLGDRDHVLPPGLLNHSQARRY